MCSKPKDKDYSPPLTFL